MRSTTDKDKLLLFLRELGSHVKGSGRIYLTGGGTALLHDWRAMTIDVDIKADPEPDGLFEAIAELKDQLDINVELASPDQFIPVPGGWQERSRFIVRHRNVDFFHYDLYSQALAKIERGHARDLVDVSSMLASDLILADQLWVYFQEIEPKLLRYPGIDAITFRQSVLDVLGPREGNL